jgi:predicted dehydrogenase
MKQEASDRGRKMKVALVGAGGFGSYRRDRMRETGLFDLVSAYDINRQTLDNACRQDGCRAAGSYEELLATPGIEAMVISTGAKFHAEQSLAALKRGLHVFVEKPVCSTLDELKALVAMQRRSGLVVGVGHNDVSAEPKDLKIKELMDSGEFGNIACIECYTAHSGGLEIKPGDWRGDPERNPGGMLFQCGVHSIHELLFLFGPIKSVSCKMRYDVHTTRTADVAQCLLTFESGLIGTMNAYHVTPYRYGLNIFGTKMALYTDERNAGYGDPGYYAVQYRKCCVAEPHQPITFDHESKDACSNLRRFYKAVREGAEMYPSLKDGGMAVAVVFAAEEASRTGKDVAIPSLWE